MSVHVRGYWRQGRYVRSYTRRPPAKVGAAGALLLVALIAIVVLAGRGHMASVGGIPGSTPRTTPIHGYVVQVASDRDRASADALRRKIESAGRRASVIRSDGYARLRPGWYVTVVGPF